MAEWDIKKAYGKCFGTDREFEIGEEFFTALVEVEGGFERRDYSIEYWSEHKPEVFYFWKTKLPDPEEKKKLFIDDNMLRMFFDRLEDQQEEDKINFRFVLMLVLMRKRLLRYEGTEIKDDKEVWTLKVTGEKRMVEVTNPHLSEDKIESLTGQIGQIMQLEDDEADA